MPYRDDLGENSPLIDIYPGPTGDNRAPVIIFVHGGGWRIGSRRGVHFKPEFFWNAGYLFCSIDYRLLPDNPVGRALGAQAC